MTNNIGDPPNTTLGPLEDEEDPLNLIFKGRTFLGSPFDAQSTYGTTASPSFQFFEDQFEEADFTPMSPIPPSPTIQRRSPSKYIETIVDDPSDDMGTDDEVGVDPDSAPGMGPDVGTTDTAEDVGGDVGDEKIICTAMNSMYGFGNFRNAIWMKYQASNPEMKKEEYELGYHKLIMPLVRRMKTSKFIRTIVEFNARQRTFNIRREMRGQETTLYYRIVEKKIILPSFFAVGWLVKKNILKKAKI